MVDGVLGRLHHAGIIPMYPVKIASQLEGRFPRGRIYLLGRRFFLTEDGGGVQLYYLPDIVTVPVMDMARIIGCHEIFHNTDGYSRQGNHIFFRDAEVFTLWVSAYMSGVYRDSRNYQHIAGVARVVDYLGWKGILGESVYPYLIDRGEEKVGVASMYGRILFDGELALPHYGIDIGEVGFPDAPQFFTQENIDRFDRMRGCRGDEDGLTVDLPYSSAPIAVARAIRGVIQFTTPEDLRNSNAYSMGALNRDNRAHPFIVRVGERAGNMYRPVIVEGRLNG